MRYRVNGFENGVLVYRRDTGTYKDADILAGRMEAAGCTEVTIEEYEEEC